MGLMLFILSENHVSLSSAFRLYCFFSSFQNSNSFSSGEYGDCANETFFLKILLTLLNISICRNNIYTVHGIQFLIFQQNMLNIVVVWA
jgi:hypothetical protein